MSVPPGPIRDNIPGFTDARQLHAYERRMTAFRLYQLEVEPWSLGDQFDLTHFQRIHAHTLSDVYPWAGHLRGPDEWTEAMGMVHCPPDRVHDYATAIFESMAAERPSHPNPHDALNTAAEYWAHLTYAHIFLDGNSRTQRAFIQLYLRSAGWDLDWRAIDADAVHAARHAAALTDDNGLHDTTWLTAQLQPGLVALGDGSPLSHNAATADTATRPVEIFAAMLEHAEADPDNDGFTFYAQQYPGPGEEQAAEDHRRYLADIEHQRRDHTHLIEHLNELEHQRQQQHREQQHRHQPPHPGPPPPRQEPPGRHL